MSDVRTTLIRKIFPALRKQGMLARANYMCCMGCASCSLYENLKELHQNGVTKKGVVYWHRQDDELLKKQNYAFLRYGAFSIDFDDPDLDEKTKEIGKIIVDVCMAAGLNITWSGDCNSCIEVYPNYF